MNRNFNFGRGLAGRMKNKPYQLNFPLIIFLVCELFTFVLWDRYFNSTNHFDRNLASHLILIMGTLFSLASGLFARVLESRRIYLEKEICARTNEVAQKEREAKSEKEWLAITLHAIGEGVMAVDTAGKIILMNEAAETLTGRLRSEGVGKPLGEVFHAESGEPPRKLALLTPEVLTGSREVEFPEEVFLIAKNGVKRVIHAVGKGLQDSQNRRIGMVLVFRDVTAEKLAEYQLRLAEEKYRSVFENSAVAIMVTDDAERVVSWNKFTENLLKMGCEDLHLRPVSTLYPEEEWNKIRRFNIRQKGMQHHLETKMKRKDGDTVDIDVSITVLKDVQGKITGSIGVIRDITERKQVERLKDEFVSMVSHELRTPIVIIRESISQVLDGMHGEISGSQRLVLSMSVKNIERLRRIIDNLLDLSKMEAGRLELNREWVSLADLAKGVAEDFSAAVEKKGLGIKLNFGRENVSLYADRDKMIQVLTNLIGNAVKFTDGGNIEISIEDQDGKIQMSVADSGKGILPEDLPRVFSKFQQFGQQRNLGEKGTGLGLAICKGIVDLHGGRIWAESRLGEGTRFSFALPKQTSDDVVKEFIVEGHKSFLTSGIPFSVLLFRFDGLGEPGRIRIASGAVSCEKLIAESLHHRASVVRKEGEKIWVLLPSTAREGALKIRARVYAVLREYFLKEGFGDIAPEGIVVNFPKDAATTEELFSKVLL